MATVTTLAAWQRFIASAPEAQREYRTIEIYHAQLDGVYRYVANYTPVMLGLEAGAPRNAGENVAFSAATLSITEPAEREDSEQNLSIGIGNAGGELTAITDQIFGSGFFHPAEIIYRKYYSGDISTPAIPPMYLYASSIVYSGPSGAIITAEDVDLTQKRSGTLFKTETYPGLRR